MVTHVVMFKLKDPSPENVQDTIDKIMGMKGKIDVLREIEVGADFMHSKRSYDLVLITRFDDREGLKTYAQHPLHQPVLAHIGDVAASAVAVDFES